MKLSQDILAPARPFGLHTVTTPPEHSAPTGNSTNSCAKIVWKARQRLGPSLRPCLLRLYSPTYTQHDIGRILQAVGVIGTPEVFYPHFGRNLAYPAKALAESYPLRPGDREINFDNFNKSFAKVLQNRDAISAHPSVAVGIHSWHTAQGIKDLETLYRDNATIPDGGTNHNATVPTAYKPSTPPPSANASMAIAQFHRHRSGRKNLGQCPLWLKSPVPASAVDQATLHTTSIELRHVPAWPARSYDAVIRRRPLRQISLPQATPTQPRRTVSFTVTNTDPKPSRPPGDLSSAAIGQN